MSHKPRKRFGQNFLHDHTIISQIIASIQAWPGQHWIEIGPGQGALTTPLLETGVKLDVIELDRDLVRFLTDKYRGQENLTIHSYDALNVNLNDFTGNAEKLHIIGNLPYNISTPLLFHLLECRNHIEEMYFMLQKEVVERICAEPGNKQYGRLSIMLQYHCSAELLFYVPAESFHPPPKVMSAVVKLSPHEDLPVVVTSQTDFNTIVTQAFSQRRKTLRNSLKKLITEDEMITLTIDPSLRAESISLSEYARLSNHYSDRNSQHSTAKPKNHS